MRCTRSLSLSPDCIRTYALPLIIHGQVEETTTDADADDNKDPLTATATKDLDDTCINIVIRYQ